MIHMPIDEQVEQLMQGTDYGDEGVKQAMAQELRTRLHEAQSEDRPLRVYCGFDPRTSDLHLGHTVPMRKMRQFQELGHEVIFVIGRFTSLIGDPSDKDKVRAKLSREQATANAETYAAQAVKILDPERTRFEYNDTWLAELSFEDLIELGSLFTIQQFLSREAFRKRFDEGDPIFLHESFYALMQGYDAYHLRADVQIGGSDQLFNIVTAARKLMEAKGVKPNIGIIHGILPGTDGVVKMSKSLGNHIPLQATPEDMYGLVMSVPDPAMGAFFRLVTRWTPAKIEELEGGMAAGDLHPRDVKMDLAKEIVSIYHGDEASKKAEAHFRRVFQEQQMPKEMPEFKLSAGITLLDVLVSAKLVKSKSEARRLIQQHGVRLEDQILEDPMAEVSVDAPQVLRVGKRRFIRLIPPDK
ncbi:MAG: tyrosine--tRNA ligase [Anaerolineales bacterium]|jgi:tyrosyl-tRNA synthetase